MEYTLHDLQKLEVYGISRGEVDSALAQPEANLFDVVERSKIKIVLIKVRHHALVINPDDSRAVTIYRTDSRTVENRKRAGRWI
ncbi:TPA: hypothetical protein DCE37_11140 [Candidatus Latescibacteria bacterium]|nr:hypothetical protein [Candidatus Latescibacterota bacterium]|tara:strand:- start:441 stop:692 length:252 start_codon:yes stop_codon:yes gene_type:complete